MTYCIGLKLERGIVFMSDTRTNAGVDNISTVRKMRTWEVPGERLITMMTAGNLATTQALVSLLDERSKAPSDRAPSILEQPTMFQVARLVGTTLKEVIAEQSPAGQAADATFGASLVLGGQIGEGEPCLFLVYPEGNFIEATPDNPFMQVGETKYGKPIILRAFDPSMSFADAAKLLLVSFDSTIMANLSVGAPIDLQYYEAGSLKRGYERRIAETDPAWREMSERWGAALRAAVDSLPPFK